MVKYKIGDVVEYRVGRHLRRVLVTNKVRDIKNGRPGFDGLIIWDNEENWQHGDMAWGYNDRIVQVILASPAS